MSKSAELSAAVARLRRGFTYGSCPDGWGECCDARLVAEHYLATAAADDGEAIDNEFLCSIGFTHPEGAMPHVLTLGCVETYPEFTNREGCRRWGIVNEACSYQVTSIPRQLRPMNRGEVRHLLKKLNIALQPIAQETQT